MIFHLGVHFMDMLPGFIIFRPSAMVYQSVSLIRTETASARPFLFQLATFRAHHIISVTREHTQDEPRWNIKVLGTANLTETP